MIHPTVLEKYKDKANRKNLGRSKNGGQIIGEEADENNKIYYIVERDGALHIEDYKTASPRIIPNMVSTTVKI